MTIRSVRTLATGLVLFTSLASVPALMAQSITGTDPVPVLNATPAITGTDPVPILPSMASILMLLGLA